MSRDHDEISYLEDGSTRVTSYYSNGESTDVTWGPDGEGITDITDHHADGSSDSYEGHSSALGGTVRDSKK